MDNATQYPAIPLPSNFEGLARMVKKLEVEVFRLRQQNVRLLKHLLAPRDLDREPPQAGLEALQ